MKTKIMRLENWLLSLLLGSLGFSSCQSTKLIQEVEPEPQPVLKERPDVRLMYGVPTMNYMVRGHVKDSDGRPIQGISVNLLERGMEGTPDSLYGDQKNIADFLQRTELKTDAEGIFTLESRSLPQESLRLLIRDTDGEKNGHFKNQIVELPVNTSEVSPDAGNGWNQGTFHKEIEVQLNRK